MKEGLPSEHGCELLRHTLEHLLDGSGVTCKQNIVIKYLQQVLSQHEYGSRNVLKSKEDLPMKVADIFSPLGGMSQTDDLTLLGIHSMKYDEFLF